MKPIPSDKATPVVPVHPARGPLVHFAGASRYVREHRQGMLSASATRPRLPDGLAVGPASVVRSRVRMDATVETQAKLQRAKERLYVACQVGGWGVFFLINAVSFKVFVPAAQKSQTELEVWCAILRVIFVGCLFTHFARPVFARLGWKELGWRALVPRIALASAAIGFGWCIVGFTLDLVVLQQPWTHSYSVVAGFIGVWVQASLTATGWLCVYFFYHVFERLNRLQVEQLRLAASVKDAELRALKSQVNPHFLFNSLNSLRALINEDAPRARETVTRLANMLRYSLQSGQLETVPFEDELRIVEDYLALEQIRHENRLRVRWDIANEARLINVPPMLLQTLVENAVKYGIGTRREGGELTIAAKLEGAALNIRVSNPGELGAPVDAAIAGTSTGLGLRNASERLKLLFGDRSSLTLLSEPAGCVTADVLIPLNPPSR